MKSGISEEQVRRANPTSSDLLIQAVVSGINAFNEFDKAFREVSALITISTGDMEDFENECRRKALA